MTKADFPYINTLAREVIASEAMAPYLPSAIERKTAEASVIVVGGFTVHDESAQRAELEKARAARLKVIGSFEAERDELAGKLYRLGVVPLAILPKAAWNRICDETGLFRVVPDKDGRILISDALVDKGREFANRMFAICALGLMVDGAAGGGYWAYQSSWGWWSIAGGLIGAVVAYFIVGFITDRMETVTERLFTRMYLRAKARRPWAQLLRDLLPNATSPAESNITAKVVLPEPPASVVATLLKLKAWPLKVAAVAEAITFADPPGKILLRAYDRDIERRERERSKGYRGYASYEEWLEKCPIIYTEHGSTVAVVAQFGDFPIERAVVDKVMRSPEYLF